MGEPISTDVTGQMNLKQNDIFLSYKSEDGSWVEKLKRSLQQRGATVWLDKDSIRPGDIFAQALENGILTSKTVAIIITPASVQSGWVQEEYYRALSLTKSHHTNIVPCILERADLPGFLANRQYIDFSDEKHYETAADRLVCPGITRRRIHVETFTHNIVTEDWKKLGKASERELGFVIRGGLSHGRMGNFISAKRRGDASGYRLTPTDETDVVVILDMTSHGTKYSADFILACRNANDGAHTRIVFVFYHPPDFFKTTNDELPNDLRERFSHYYVIEKAEEMASLRRNLRRAWNAVLQDLVRSARLSGEEK